MVSTPQLGSRLSFDRKERILILYFAYGSNLHPSRLRARVSSAQPVTTGFIDGRSLRFHKKSRDGSSKCDMPPAQRPGARIYGALYSIEVCQKRRLDQVECAGAGYAEVSLAVMTDYGPIEAFSYVAQSAFIQESLLPYHWYKRLVVEGATFHRFPESYIAAITAVPSKQDPRPERAEENLRVLGNPSD